MFLEKDICILYAKLLKAMYFISNQVHVSLHLELTTLLNSRLLNDKILMERLYDKVWTHFTLLVIHKNKVKVGWTLKDRHVDLKILLYTSHIQPIAYSIWKQTWSQKFNLDQLTMKMRSRSVEPRLARLIHITIIKYNK